MTPEQFAYWLQGFVELNGGKQPEPEQWQSIQDHLKTVFAKVTPDVGFRFPDQGVRTLELRQPDVYPGLGKSAIC